MLSRRFRSQQGFHGQAQATFFIGLQHLNLHNLAFFQEITNRVHALVGNLGDVQQTILAWQHADNCTEIEQLQHGAFIHSANFNLSRDVFNQLFGTLTSITINRGDGNRTVFLDVDACTSLLGNATNGCTTFANHVTDLFRVDLHGDHARGVGRQFAYAATCGLFHDTQNVHAAFTGLRQRNLHDLFGYALNLDVHLQCSHTILSTGNLEVHVAQVIFITQNVCEYRKLVVFLDQAHGNTGHQLFQGNTCVHQRQCTTAHRRHRA